MRTALRRLLRCLVFLGPALACATAVAAEMERVVAPSPAVAGFERFLRSSTPVCKKQPSARCVDAGWHFADADRDGSLSLDELKSIHDAGRTWIDWKGGSMSEQERASVMVGLLIVQGVGVEQLMRSYDGDGDGRLSRAELLADVTLDQRPLGKVLSDPNGLDRKATARRLGPMGVLFERMFR